MKTIHPKKTLSFDDRLQVIVGSNGSGKSTFAKKLREKYGFDYYNSSESAPHRRLNGSMAYSEDVRFDMLSVMSSDGESQFQELAGFIGKSKSSTVILDEPEK